MDEPRVRQRCEVYSRVVGYLRPIQQWNVGKRAEYADRRAFVVPGDETRTGRRTA